MCAFLDHGQDGTGEPLHLMLRPGNAGSNTAADHIAVTRKALAQLPSYRPGTRPGPKVLIRTDAAGATHDFLDWLHERRLSYSVGFTLGDISEVLAKIPASVWTPAYDADGKVRSIASGAPRARDPAGLRHAAARRPTSSEREGAIPARQTPCHGSLIDITGSAGSGYLKVPPASPSPSVTPVVTRTCVDSAR